MPGTGRSVGVASESMYSQQEFGEQRIARRVVHQPVAGQIGEVAQALVAGVEQPQLHQLVGRHVVDEQHVDVLERRAAVGEVVLEHPRRERLGGHRPLVLDAEFACQHGDDVGRGDRGDPVDHRVGEAGVLAHPLGQPRVHAFGVRRERLPGDVSVAFDVVARHDRGRCDTAVAPSRQRVGDQTEDVDAVPAG